MLQHSLNELYGLAGRAAVIPEVEDSHPSNFPVLNDLLGDVIRVERHLKRLDRARADIEEASKRCLEVFRGLQHGRTGYE